MAIEHHRLLRRVMLWTHMSRAFEGIGGKPRPQVAQRDKRTQITIVVHLSALRAPFSKSACVCGEAEAGQLGATQFVGITLACTVDRPVGWSGTHPASGDCGGWGICGGRSTFHDQAAQVSSQTERGKCGTNLRARSCRQWPEVRGAEVQVSGP